MNKELWYYDKITAYNARKYNGIFTANMISGDELAIKNVQTDDFDYFYPLKKDKVNYLLPSHHLKSMPLKVFYSDKMSFRSKAYEKIEEAQSVNVAAEKTMSYKRVMDSLMNFEHESPREYLIWKLISDAAYCSRINIRAMSYPGWLKDSPLVILSMLRGDVSTVNKPTFAKLKYLLNAQNKILGINEIQNLKAEDVAAMAKYYEDIGDFKPKFVGDSRAAAGTGEEVDITNHSSMTFYNFPEEGDMLFDEVFHPKIMSRIFPILLSGGSNTVTACREVFHHVDPMITDDEFEQLNVFLKNHKYYEFDKSGLSDDACLKIDEDFKSEMQGKDWKCNFVFKNTRWQRNYETICGRIRLYAETEEEFKELELLLYTMHKNYISFIQKRADVVEDAGKEADVEDIYLGGEDGTKHEGESLSGFTR